jgi:two-component sensor histidine kinase
LMWLGEKELTRIILIVDELNNNSIEYWSKKWDINKLRINISKDNNEINLKIEVEDSWKWRKPKKALELETLRAHQLKLGYRGHNSIRWRGLFMITVNVVDRLYFKDADTWWLIVWIRKKMII